MGSKSRGTPPRLRIVQGASQVIRALMEAQGITKAELARRVDKSRAYVTQSLSGDRNMTLSTFASFADALNADPVIDARPRQGSYGKLVPRRRPPTSPQGKKGAE